MICEECLEPSADPVDGSRLDMCAGCIERMRRRSPTNRGTTSNGRPWIEGVHFAIESKEFVCLVCTRKYTIRQSLRQHLKRRHLDALPSAAAV